RVTIVADDHKSAHLKPNGKPGFHWRSARMTKEIGRQCYFELVDRSRDGWLAVDRIVFSDHQTPPPETAAAAEPLVLNDPDDFPESAWGMISFDEEPRDIPLHVRGNHKNLGEPVPRGFLRVIAGDSQKPVPNGSGRLEIADWFTSPLAARVIVNRIWKHHFGHGLVRTTDNFGQTGERPTHPELLDTLAASFVAKGWSIKDLHRDIVLSAAYRMSSATDPKAAELDPRNDLLHHFPVRRLEAEAIRDSMLAVSGRLDPALYGPSIPPHISKYQDGRGKPKSGPLDGAGRRSIYIQVRRNFLTPLFLAFDYPLPISAIGARGTSTVPSQALLMLNNEFVAQQAKQWAARVTPAFSDPSQRLDHMYKAAFARLPEDWERSEALTFALQRGWTELSHVLLNSAEFLYVR
ncbi:MAG: DUF1553 domain-containing protein, partial [Bryobacterales bacterium]|nr:DUF1553 domain-containing protein [Bryobacterales bacterium]